MDNFKSLKYSSLISLVGDELTNIAVLTIIYTMTRSASLVASLFIIRTMTIFTSGLLVPATIGWIKKRKSFLITIDLARAIA